MASKRREAQREARQARQAALMARQQVAKRKRTAVTVALAAAVVVALFFVFSGGRSKATKVATTGSSTSLANAPTTANDKAPVKVPKAPAGASITGETPCPAADGSSPRTVSFAKEPPMCVDAARTYVAEMKTTKGTLTISLDPKRAPRTVNSFVVLSRYHYFDGVSFHRIIPGFVVQGGDPEGTGMGGPGYKFADELPKAGEYKLGSLVMANSGPDTNGSQFFIITGGDGVALPPKYALFGQITSGMDVAKAIEAVGTAAGSPTEVVTIESVTITET